MSDPSSVSRGQLSLPARPSREHRKSAAERRLEALRQGARAAKLSEAQFQLARDHGFASWRAMKAEVDRRANPPDGRFEHEARPARADA